MNFVEYSPLALRTAKPLTDEQNILHARILMISEAGEITNPIKALAIQGKPIDKVNLVEEVGDLLWGLNLYLTTTGKSLSAVDDAVAEYSSYLPLVTDVWQLVDTAVKVGVFASGIHSATVADTHADRLRDSLSVRHLCGYLVQILDYAGCNFSQCLEANLAKLEKRHGAKFSAHSSLNRDLDAEHAVLSRSLNAKAS
jgi:NTP pyrophosphatase (non-canonical NTP hydrolase)